MTSFTDDDFDKFLKSFKNEIYEDNNHNFHKCYDSLTELSKSGSDVAAHFLDTTQDAMAIAHVSRELANCQAWIVAGKDFATPLLRKTLAIIALNIQNDAGNNFPIIIIFL